jgi:hypothetical protein
LKTRLLKIYAAAVLFVLTCIVNDKAYAQETGDNASYYYNLFDTNYLLPGFSNVSTSIIVSSASADNLSLNNASGRCLSTTNTGTAGRLYKSFITYGSNINNSDWEWSLLYKNTGGNPGDSQVMGTATNAWRYWLFADGTTSTTAKGLYITQIGNTLYVRYKYDNDANYPDHYNAITSCTLANNVTYNIKIQRIKGGLIKLYADPYTASTPEAKTLRGRNYVGENETSTYYYSMLEASTTTNGRFLFDELKMYTRIFQFTGYTAGLTPSPVFPSQTNVIAYALQIKMRGNFEFKQFQVAQTVAGSTFFSAEQLYKSADNTFTPAVPAPDTLKATSNGSGYFSDINDVYQTSGNTDGSLVTVGYYYVAGNVKAGISEGNLQYTSVSQITTKDNDSAPTYTGYNGGGTTGTVITFASPYVWYGGSDKYWSTYGNWRNSGGTTVNAPPNDGTAYVLIPAGVANTPTSQTAYYDNNAVMALNLKSLTVAASSKLTLVKNHTLQIGSGGLIVNGTLEFSYSNDSNWPYPNLDGDNTLTIASGATATVNNLILNKLAKSNTVTLANNNAQMYVSGTITPTRGTLAANGYLTLTSTATATATVATINTSDAAITGNVNVQRYLTGNSASSRGYRLLSSPVSVASNNLILPNLSYIYNNAYLTGTLGTLNGFDAIGNPTLYFYREDMAPNSASFISGNFRGISKLNNSSLYSFSLNNEASAYTLPAGNGFLFFFRGDKATTSNPTVTTTIAKPTTFTATGVLNQGNVVVRHWTKASGTNELLYTSATANTKVRGYNLVGNPYASSIDWDKFGTSITGTNISNKIYVYNPTLKAYAIYQKGNAGVGTNFNGATGSANVIPSGQGFFVVATGTNPTLTFTEAAKVSTQVTSTTLLMSTSAIGEKEAPVQYVHLQLVKDSLNSDESLIFFKGGAKTEFDDNEDAEYLAGNNLVNLSSLSADQRQLAINRLAYPQVRRSIPLKAKIYLNGTYQLNIKALKNIPPNYSVWLVDNFKKDSLDIRANKTYSFNAITTDTTTFANRFAIVIGKNPAYNLRLLDFKAAKATAGSQLTWLTENEYDDTHFAIERSIDDGKTFEVLGTSQSTSNGTYTLTDKFPIVGVNKYRLRVEDMDGTITYSKILSIIYTNTVNPVAVNKANINIYPNPVASTVNVAIAEKAGAAAGSYTINITNGLGNVMKTATTSQLTWNGNINSWLPGSYFVQVVDNTTKAIVGNGKFVKN